MTLAAVGLVAVIAAMLPLLRVVTPGAWTAGALGLVAAVFAVGAGARLLRWRAWAVSATEAGVWVVGMTAMFGGSTALFGIIPTLETARAVPLLIDAALGQIRDGSAPLAAGAPLALLLVGAAGLLAIAMDHVVVTARMPMLAVIGLVAVYLIPSIAVPAPIDVAGFVLFAAAILAMFAAETAAGRPARTRGRPSRVRPGTLAATAAVGVTAIVVTVAVTPLLPAPTTAGSVVAVRGNSIDPSLELGQDLRRPQEVDVLRLRSDAPSPPYLRAVTLSRFDGQEWESDRDETASLDDGFEQVSVASGINVAEYTATIEITNYVSPWLPVPFPAVDVDGIDGQWQTRAANRTVLSDSASPQGQDYEVTYRVPQPSREQIRASDADGRGLAAQTRVPGDDELVAEIRAQALEVTASTSTDYDALVALQRWFRSPDFEYSLSAPVADGFDGSGLDAVRDFLTEKSGYCIHFASAFAIMARTLDMPARIVVGYLPGAATDERIDEQTVHTVVSSQLHAWPEVHFEGIGWVAFEPTNSLGVPTAFAAAASGTSGDGGGAQPLPQDAVTPEGDEATPEAGRLFDETGAPIDQERPLNPGPLVGVLVAAIGAAAVPGLWRLVRRREREREAADGDAAAAWSEIVDTALDLGVAVAPGESARALGSRLIAEHGAPPGGTREVVAAIERTSYARPAQRGAGDAGLDEAVAEVRRGLLAAADRRSRVTAALAPRSLLRAAPRESAAAGSG
ncbi:DUF3488 and transglutaminase-like domain-containing protein [Microbacterium sp. LRZ72]|uniref:transglutaminase family protein n=1 Tax=Microbacterium sp. LRZ72 TaxID=2942481 RepID=UPI0029B6C057|nr:DUF3488 and transglutaminase-like domain-containing protein [Microbacterium sp. LRZ72]MDX2376877.1 DUF3488 and transglutaminase-like domain-containing protein [Microbacterium sp. LRZ72]